MSFKRVLVVTMIGLLLLSACDNDENDFAETDDELASEVEEESIPEEAEEAPPADTDLPDDTMVNVDLWQPTPGTTWQWQLSGEINTSFDVVMYDIDLFDAPQGTIESLQADGRIVICYFSAGSWEEWREDADQFPEEVLGKTMQGWPDEKWLDISQIALLAPVMLARLDLAVVRGCDGVEPDNVGGYGNDTGFDLTYDDQIAYNIWLAEEAHQRNLSIGLKNDLDQIRDLVGFFDWALNEECFAFDECEMLLPFVEAGKAVFGVEYDGDPDDYCPQAVSMSFSWLTKDLDLVDEPPNACQ